MSSDRNVTVTRTTFTLKDYCKAVMRAWKQLCGAYPSKAAVGCLWAQYALETGRGAACWNNNIGNVKHTPGHDYIMLRGTWEIVNGTRLFFEPPHPATWFNAYASLDAAMAEHLRLLKERRYASSWPAIEAGNPGEFAVQLKAKGYYTAPVDDYATGLRAHHAEFMRTPSFEDAMLEMEDDAEAPTLPEMPRVENAASQPTLHPDPSAYLRPLEWDPDGDPNA